MKRNFRIKKIQIEDIEAWLKTPFIVEVPKYYVYAVQMRKWYGWITIKTFDEENDWEAHSRALNLLDELNKETL
jgi:hypothetical protein